MRKWHRWVSLPAALFLLSVAVTGVILQFQQFFGADEAQREKLAAQTSAYSLDTPGADIAARIDRARAAVQAKLGNGKLDAVEIQLKGEHPTVTFHVVGASARKVVVNADTGTIEKDEPDVRESFILRLHTGEVFGDGGVVLGMVWGTALVVLTLTGIYLYWQMYRARAKVKGWKHIFWLLPLSFLMPHAAFAGSPFLTDDPGFAPKGWEVKFASAYEHRADGDTLTAPILDLNYTIVEHFKLNATFAGKSVFPDQRNDEFGLADTDFKFKWRFIDEKPGTWQPAFSIAPNITFPTGDNDRGLGDDQYKFRFPVQVGKTFGKFYTYGELGYQWSLSGDGDDQWIYGAALQYQLTDKLNIGAELNGSSILGIIDDYNLIANVGAVYTFDEHWQLQGSVGTSLTDNGPDLLVQVFIQWNF